MEKMDASSFFSKKSAYEEWIESEGVPIYQGHAVADLRGLELAPWRRLGAMGGYAYLKGGGGTTDAYVCELAPGQRTNLERHLYEKWLLILDGEGGIALIDDREREHRVAWRAGTLFSVPLNVPHYHFNSGQKPARFVAVSSAPVAFDLYHNTDFIMGSEIGFRDRYDFEEGYFSGDGALIEAHAPVRGRERTYWIWATNLVPDVHSLALHRADRAREVEINHIQIELCHNTMTSHISQWPQGTYMPSHFHGPGAHIIVLSGEGYSLLWRGDPWYSRGFDQARVDWHPGSMLAVPGAWFHQHFNLGAEPARVLAIRWGSFRHRLNMVMGEGGHGEYATISIRDGGNQVDYQDEDPYIGQLYEAELAKRGLQPRMSFQRG